MAAVKSTPSSSTIDLTVTLTQVKLPCHELEAFADRYLTLNNDLHLIVLGRSSSTLQKNLIPAHDNGWIASPVVSRNHATLKAVMTSTGVDLILKDNDSSHGTFVNGSKLPKGGKHILHTGDCIRLGVEVAQEETTFKPPQYLVAIKDNVAAVETSATDASSDTQQDTSIALGPDRQPCSEADRDYFGYSDSDDDSIDDYTYGDLSEEDSSEEESSEEEDSDDDTGTSPPSETVDVDDVWKAYDDAALSSDADTKALLDQPETIFVAGETDALGYEPFSTGDPSCTAKKVIHTWGSRSQHHTQNGHQEQSRDDVVGWNLLLPSVNQVGASHSVTDDVQSHSLVAESLSSPIFRPVSPDANKYKDGPFMFPLTDNIALPEASVPMKPAKTAPEAPKRLSLAEKIMIEKAKLKARHGMSINSIIHSDDVTPPACRSIHTPTSIKPAAAIRNDASTSPETIKTRSKSPIVHTHMPGNGKRSFEDAFEMDDVNAWTTVMDNQDLMNANNPWSLQIQDFPEIFPSIRAETAKEQMEIAKDQPACASSNDSVTEIPNEGKSSVKLTKQHSEPALEPPRKKSRLSSFLAGVAVGVFAGGAGVLGTLVALPENFFA